MSKYIGLTFYLVGLILLSYTFFFLSGGYNRYKEKLSNTGHSVVLTEDTGNIVNSSKNENIENTGSDLDQEILDIIPSADNATGNENNLGKDIEYNDKDTDDNQTGTNDIIITGNNDISSGGGENIITGDKIKLENIYIGVEQLNITTYTGYDELFDLLGLISLPTYKVSNKDIFVKELKSVDYENEKNNIKVIVEKIGGNVKETNLFGEKQLFINPDVYFHKIVIMLVKYDYKLYLVVMPYTKYKDYKQYLKEVLFIKQ